MPIIHKSAYKGPPFYQYNGHLQTILPALMRKVEGINYERERFTLSDGDFVDLDWIDKGSKNLVFLSHGLEGNSERHYMKGMAKKFKEQNWDIVAWNCRSCSGEMNLKPRLYNHGEIGDIAEVIEHIIAAKSYEKIVLIGFSMGGNIIMKYLGVHGAAIPSQLYKAIAFSSPTDLKGSADLLNFPKAKFYKNRFLKMLKAKMEVKAEQYPHLIDMKNFNKIQRWQDFDDYFTAPLNGYKDAEHFYYEGSAQNFMKGICIPTLLVNAKNDPILSRNCYPAEICEKHKYIYLETPQRGGHVGFSRWGKSFAWSEYRALEFVNS
jgi:predicted alpha/beta-fold hydrolase